MSEHLITSVVWVLMAIVGVATIAVLVSKKSDTSNVLSSLGSEFGCMLGTAVSPIAGGVHCAPAVSSSISFGS